MPYIVAFSTSQVQGAPNAIVLTDSSTGSDGTVASRRIYLQDDIGNYLVPSGSLSYIDWPLVQGNAITLSVLNNRDMALFITLNYVTNTGAIANGATLTQLQGFTLYNEDFYYSLTQDQALQNQPPPVIIQDSRYYTSKMILRVEIDSGNQAIIFANDIMSAQECYDRATYIRLNKNDYF
jgi:hypothetical protein